mmetsp:Transcript_563/g.2047  ORF Transcript_563/g.2047 Transcript_563/m.2047 type:complete len:305 (-) Transcript_563:12-926(-)
MTPQQQLFHTAVIHLVSDVHLELGAHKDQSCFPTPPTTKHRKSTCCYILCLAGDICSVPKIDIWRTFLRQKSSEYNVVLFVGGNHEFYHSEFHQTLASMRMLAQSFPNVHFLNGDDSKKESRGVWSMDLLSPEGAPPKRLTFLGAILWSHVTRAQQEIVQMGLNDYRLIRLGQRALSTNDTNAFHAKDLQFLLHELKQRQNTEIQEDIIVMTHHAPLKDEITEPQYLNSPINSAFCTDLRWVLDRYKIKAWFFGHTHWSTEFVYNGCTVISNQVGYGSSPPSNYRRDWQMGVSTKDERKENEPE